MIIATSIQMKIFNKAVSVLRCISTFKKTPVMACCDPSTSCNDKCERFEHKDCEDKHSFALPDKAVVRHISLTWDVDFTKCMIKGSSLLTFESYEPVDEVVLDISKDLQIQSAQLEDGSAVPYSIDCTGLFGAKLSVSLDPCKQQGHEVYTPVLKASKCKSKKKMKCKKILCRRSRSRCNIPPCCARVQYIKHFPLRYNGFTYSVAMARVLKRKRREVCAPPPQFCVRKCCLPCKDEVQKYRYRFKVRLNYNTTPCATGLQWLQLEQTSSKVAPFLFSQCQPIHARSVFPCQDTPQVKFTYDAEVTAQARYTVVMSALLTETINSKNLTQDNCRTFKFYQPIPVPSYLVALAVGVLKCEQIGPRSRVYAEPDVIERAAFEFADTEKYLSTAEKMFGPYVWEQYDLLVLPPSFPYGGMENPNLTFVTPTLLSGDRSQADVIIHEIMHSWTGNLVTNKNFENFWLNEGFTVFLERKVIGKIWGSKHRDFESLLGYQELEETLMTMKKDDNLSKLCPDLTCIHPDEAYSRVPYEKGSLFLRYLEDLVGGPKYFDDFIRAYIQRFERSSLDSEQFKNFFMKQFAGCPALCHIDWCAWLRAPGPPPNYPVLNAELTKPVQKIICKMYSEGVDFLCCSDVKGFSPHQIIYLLQEMLRRPPLEIKYLREVGKEYRIEGNTNTEIQFRWYRLCIISKDQAKVPEILEFLSTYGRMKYVRPLYRDLYMWPEIREQARANFLKTECHMMHITRHALRKELHLTDACKDRKDGGCKCGS